MGFTIVCDCQSQASSAPDAKAETPLSYGVPESPAFTFLGMSPTKITRPTTPRDFAAALVQGTDSAGRAQTGVAISATMWSIVPNADIPLSKYRSPVPYALANTQLSIGTARPAGDTASTTSAVGLRSVLYDASDPMRNNGFVSGFAGLLSTCLGKLKLPPFLPGATPSTNALPDDVRQCMDDGAKQLRKEWFDKNWNAPALSVGGAVGWQLLRSQWDTIQSMGAGVWMSGAMPVGSSGQVLGQLQYDHRSRHDSTVATNVVTYGARGIVGDGARNYFVEVVGTGWRRLAEQSSRSNVQWSGGVEFQIVPSTWLSTGFGTRYQALGKPNKAVVIANLRWGVSSDARFASLYKK